MLGDIIGGRYQIVRYLGGGGFGQTYLASDRHLPGKPLCVVKKLMPRVNEACAFDVARRLFNREAEVLYALGSHDQIPQLFAHFEENREFYLVQQYIEGTVLSKELKPGRSYDETQVIELLSQILAILSFVHQQQVIHRDIKPSNLIRQHGDQSIVMIDFGGVKQIGVETLNSEASTVTIAIGSSGYMPNEQLAGKPRFSSDIYAVGMVGIQALTGCSPSHLPEDLKTGEILWRDRAPHVSDALAEVLDTMTRYDYRQRYQSATEVLDALKELAGQVISSTTVVEVSRHKAKDPSESFTHSLGCTLPLDDTSMSRELTSTGSTIGRSADDDIAKRMSTPFWSSQSSTEEINGYMAWYERADELFQQQRFQKAAESYGKVVKVTPNDYVVWFKLAMALEHVKQYGEAIDAYTRVIELKADDYLAWFRRGKVLELLQRFDEALESFERVLQIQPQNYWAWHDRGRLLEASHRFEDAIQSYDRAVQLKPDFQLAIDSRKYLLERHRQIDRLYHLQHYDEAIASCDRMIKDNPQDALAWLMRGMALENSKQYKAAIKSYNNVLKLQPGDHLAWFRRGALLEKLGVYGEAAKSYREVTRLQPDNCWAWNDQGRVLEALHQYEHALAAYEQAIRIRSDYDSAIEGRKRVIQQLQLSKHSSSKAIPMIK